MWTTSPCTVPSQDQELTRGFYTSSDAFDPLSSDDYREVTTESAHGQTGRYDDMDKRSAVHISESRLTGVFDLGFDGRYRPAGWKEHFGGDMHTGSERLSSGKMNAMGHKWAAGSSGDALLSSPLSVGTGSELSAVFANDLWESGASNVDGQESREIVASGNESSDGDGEGHNEADDQNPSFDPEQFESLWTGPTPCYLGGCRPGRLYRTSQTWYSHVKNVHKKALFCSEPGCTHTRPFANNTDLKRHNETIHEAKKPFKCESSLCTRTVKAWSRKDKLKLHNSKYHSNYKCFFCSQNPHHERWYDTESELWAHTTSSHPDV